MRKILSIVFVLAVAFIFVGCKKTYEISLKDSDKNINLVVGGEQQVTPTYTEGATLEWKSGNNTIATVENGLIKGLKAGTTTITVSIKEATDVEAKIEVTVTDVKVTGITITGNTTMVNGTEQTLAAVIAPTNATDKTVTWSTSDATTATVTNGVVKALKVGTVTIKAKANDGSNIEATITITISHANGAKEDLEVPVLLGLSSEHTFKKEGNVYVTSKITVATDTTAVLSVATTKTYNGTTWNLTDKYLFDGSAYSASAAEESYWAGDYIFTYDPATKKTTYNVTYKALDPTDFVITINGTDYANGATINLTELDEVQITVRYLPEGRVINEGIDWVVVNTSLASIDDDGNLKVLSFGRTTLRAVSHYGDLDYSYTLELAAKYFPAESITITAAAPFVEVGDMIKFTAVVSPARASQAVTWSVDDATKATINPTTGVLTGLAAGTVIVTATSTDVTTVTKTYSIEVKVASIIDTSKIQVNPTYLNLYDQVIVDGITYVVGKNAFATLQEALEAVDEGGEIYVAAGKYVLSGTLAVNKAVKFYGPYKDALATDTRDIDHEAQINTGGDDKLIDISARGVEFNGLYFSPQSTKGMRLLDGAGDVIWRSNIFIGFNSAIRQDAANLKLYGYLRFYDNKFSGTTQFILWLQSGSCANLNEITFEDNIIDGGGTVGSAPSALIRLQDAGISSSAVFNFVHNTVTNVVGSQYLFGVADMKVTVSFNNFDMVALYFYTIETTKSTNFTLEYNIFKNSSGQTINPNDYVSIKEYAYATFACTSLEELEEKYAQFLAGTLDYPNLPTVKITTDATDLYIEDELDLEVTVTEGYDLVWTSSNTAIATVDQNGKVTPVAKGAVTITATIKNMTISSSITLTIFEADVPEVPLLLVDPAYTTAGEIITKGDTQFVVGVDAFATIQAALDAAIPGSVILVAAGTYPGALTISKAITISGPNADINPITGTRDAEAIISGLITVTAANVMVNGISFSGATGQILLNPGANNFSIKYCTNDSATRIGAGTGFIYGSAAISGLYVDSCKFTAHASRGIYFTSGIVTDATIINSYFAQIQTDACDSIRFNCVNGDFVIEGNTFEKCGQFSIFLGSVSNTATIAITNNLFDVAGATYTVSIRTITKTVDVSKNIFKNIAAPICLDLRVLSTATTAVVKVNYNAFMDAGKTYIVDAATPATAKNYNCDYNFYATAPTQANVTTSQTIVGTFATIEEYEAALEALKNLVA